MQWAERAGMNVLLDTRTLPAQDRVGAFEAAFNAASKPTDVAVTPDVVGQLQAFALSPALNVVQLDLQARELQVRRSGKHLRAADPGRLSVAFNRTGTCLTSNHGRQETRNQVLRLTDLTTSYRIVQKGRCWAIAVEVDHADLDMSVGQVRAAMEHASESPLHPLLCRHLVDIAAVAQVIDPVARLEVAASIVHLVRGMLKSVSPRDGDRRQAKAETMRLRIEEFVRARLGEADLTPSKVAAAHHISLRYLYVVLADVGLTPSEWIMSLRLDTAAKAMSLPGASVASTARACGFKDPSHFARRFRAARGMTPTDFMTRQAERASLNVDDGREPAP